MTASPHSNSRPSSIGDTENAAENNSMGTEMSAACRQAIEDACYELWGEVVPFPSKASPDTATWPPVEITLWENASGPCSKYIALGDDGTIKLRSDCKFTGGRARRTRLTELSGETPYQALAGLIEGMAPNQMLTAGRIIEGIGGNPHVVVKARLGGQLNTIARSKDFVHFVPGEPAPMLIDYDRKGMPYAVRDRIDSAGGPWEALVSAVPALTGVGRVVRRSTSSGIRNAETGVEFPGSGGLHIYTLVADGADIKRALDILHDRAWLAGLGWYLIGKAGRLLERSIIDTTVDKPEHPIFEGAPVVVPPLVQDLAARRPAVYEGAVLDTVAALPPLTDEECAQVRELKAAARQRLQPEADSAQEKYARAKADERAEKEGISPEDAYTQIKSSLRDNRLMPWHVLEFDDGSVATVEEVLADRERYDKKTGLDPYEGAEYGPCKFQVYRSGMAHSFAHGGADYKLVSAAEMSGSGFEGTNRWGWVSWRNRDIPDPEFIGGKWMTTTTRAIVNAPTGLGKTMFAIAGGMAWAAGRDFLHWKTPRPAKVIYVDGEMAPRLLRQRLIGEARRLGVDPENFSAISRLEMENFQPLNTKAGQDTLEAEIKLIGKPDIIIFDNVMSLVSGDMKDDVAWEPVKLWTFRLTKHDIGQLWVHHTGLDKSHGFGTSTREWTLDTVLHLAAVDRTDTDVSFKVTFSKARERTPQTRRDFAPIDVALVNDVWTTDQGQCLGKVPPLALKFLDALRTAAADNPLSVTAPFPFASLAAWREECVVAGLLKSDKPNSARAMLSQNVRILREANFVEVDGEMVRLLV